MDIFGMRTEWRSRAAVFRWQATIALIVYMIALAPAALCAAEHKLILATKRGDLGAVTTLLANGTDPDVRDTLNNTALIFAARDGHRDIAEVLINHGAAVDWQDDEGVTPLIIGSFKGHIGIVRLLLRHGARLDIRDKWDRTALTYALRRGRDDEIARLLQSTD